MTIEMLSAKTTTTSQPIVSQPPHSVLQRKCSCGSSPGPSSECAECRKKRLLDSPLQAKLLINRPGDRSEREADRMADVIMRMPEPKRPAIQRSYSDCEEEIQRQIEPEEEEEEVLQAKPLVQRRATSQATASTAPPIVSEVLRSSGQPLGATTRSFMESRFGHDFSRVRVHSDTQAAKAARAVNARAYTAGRDVVFGSGQYAPGTLAGQRLLAHEMVHVMQQQEAGGQPGVVQREMIYAAGYARPYKVDEAEIKNAEAGDWSPSSVDFRKSAMNSGGGSGAGTFAKLLKQLEGKHAGSITKLGLIGHSNSVNFGLSGTVKGKDVWFTQPGLINTDTINEKLVTIDNKKLPDRFTGGARIILYGCNNAGSGKGLLDAISRAFKVCVEGFKNEIDFCFKWRPPKPRKDRSRTIYNRGRASYTPPIDLSNPDPLAGLESAEKDCDKFQTDLKNLSPDQKSCVGVPQKKPAEKSSELDIPSPSQATPSEFEQERRNA